MPSAVIPYLPAAVASAVLLLGWWAAKRKPRFRLARRRRPGDGH